VLQFVEKFTPVDEAKAWARCSVGECCEPADVVDQAGHTALAAAAGSAAAIQVWLRSASSACWYRPEGGFAV
jgi:hypothetical protein